MKTRHRGIGIHFSLVPCSVVESVGHKFVIVSSLQPCEIWVNIEPFPTPNIVKQDLRVLQEEVSLVNRMAFSCTDYSTEVTAFTQYKQFFNDRDAEAIAFCNERGVSYHIKEGRNDN